MTASAMVERGVLADMTEVDLLTLQIAARSVERSARAEAVAEACQARLDHLAYLRLADGVEAPGGPFRAGRRRTRK